MDEKPNEKKEQEEQVAEKKTYRPPTLAVYGKLIELTAVGTKTGTAQENSGPDKTKWRP